MSRPQFGGGEEEKIKQAVGTFCSNQPFALEIIKTKQKKDSRFTSFIQVPFLFFFFFLLRGEGGAVALVTISPISPPGGGEQQTVSPAAAQRYYPRGDAAPHQVPPAAGEHREVHRLRMGLARGAGRAVLIFM